MSGKVIDGRKIAREVGGGLKKEVETLGKRGIVPRVAVILAGNDQASEIYVRNKRRKAGTLGIESELFRFGSDASQEEIEDCIRKLNNDKNVHGILVQLPLPGHIDRNKIVSLIDPGKDVDCFHPENVGKNTIGGMNSTMVPVTATGIMKLLEFSGIPIEGKKAVVVGRSNVVGKPTAIQLLHAGATVTVCHSKTEDLKKECLEADILVVATGHAGLVTANMVKDGAVVIDVGISALPEGEMVGDTDFEKVKEKASFITPVPGGVGPMTIIMLMRNVVEAAKAREQE
ncbi:MAG: bifunctional methylenetetrahydrofolate dehydrogenase/methenyltetrahydrofolate cyclohydrolase [Candidatus Moranbacteria bacterium]|nr:bifunctional methylenetetrahydrofolate dehydrogenase/methenyltetrahydrofolate cyclohydrolase [Candidatus Moranbacteria bacterium]